MKLRNVEVSGTQVQIISEEVGKEVFEQQKEAAEEAYAKPEVAAPAVLEKDKRDAVLYIMADGSAVNTRIQDKDGSSWREVKLGLTFLGKDIIHRKNGKGIITQKEYVAYLGSVEEFKKFLFDSAARTGYGKVKKVVFIGDGAAWVWNMSKELFPDAECILDYYHLKENVYNYAKALHPADEQKSHAWAETVMKQAGMRWGSAGAQYMAALRAKFESKRWNEVTDVIFGKIAS